MENQSQNVIPVKSVKIVPHIRLTDRDEAILVFILDQKFATLEAIYHRFFDGRKSPGDAPPKEFHTTRQRLALLQRHDFIKREKVYTEGRSLYLLDKKGYQWLSGRGLSYGPMIHKVDFRQFEHDLKVTNCRIALEKAGKALQWFSDRRVRMIGFKRDLKTITLKKDSVFPDGIFLNPKGEYIAFELELSDRMFSRFKNKERYYRGLMSDKVIDKVLWVVDSPKLEADLCRIIENKERFFLDRYDTFRQLLNQGGVR